ncbi:hypothetical protein [Puia dinghuensis]|uniref:Large polyvalent protein associated domain-containing protein n=1 Tax=Puia dinghuensis TaxID=1792502 RepID=A0A8J2XQG0_9BACT|nr:hypothetical protein [Puia dinghuensis]GGA92800.1 hypothetical protein GCM10011511_15260 [Puia dinghuensis]
MNSTKQSITEALKKAGYNARQVSVRNRNGGYSSSLTITIRDASVNYEVVEQIGKNHKHVHYDEHSGEILSGGNTFVETDYTDQVRDIWAKKYSPLVDDAIVQLVDDNAGIRIDDRFTIFKDGRNNYKIWDEYDSWLPMHYYNPRDIAVDLYIRSTFTESNVTQTAVDRYWFRVIRGDEKSWKDSAGEYNTTAMGEAAAEHFHCKSENGDTDAEKNIFDWAVLFAERLPKAA